MTESDEVSFKSLEKTSKEKKDEMKGNKIREINKVTDLNELSEILKNPGILDPKASAGSRKFIFLQTVHRLNDLAFDTPFLDPAEVFSSFLDTIHAIGAGEGAGKASEKELQGRIEKLMKASKLFLNRFKDPESRDGMIKPLGKYLEKVKSLPQEAPLAQHAQIATKAIHYAYNNPSERKLRK